MAIRLVKRSTAVLCFALAVAVILLAGRHRAILGADPPPAAGQAPYVRSPPGTGRTKSDEAGKRLREGTRLIDVEGRFDSNGDRWIFYPGDSGESYKVLENLALERIHKVVEETRANEKPRWLISATITEYQGSNYLLVTKAVIKVPDVEQPPQAGNSRAPARAESVESTRQITAETP